MFAKLKNLETFFIVNSYLVVLCGFISLLVSGTFTIVETILFFAIFIFAWGLENSRWQISERVGTFLIVFTIPLFYLGW